MRLTADYPQIWFLGFLIVAIAVGRIWPHGPEWQAMAGIVLAAAGLAMISMATLRMRIGRTTLDPYGKPEHLVTSGVFAISRNPIYLGNALLIAGTCLAFAAPLAALILVPAFVTVINRRFIPREEANLRSAFPQEFPAYAMRVRRWI
ncbi:isoprenylcysteine carboxylmethyltransferase family protein [Paracoccus caeni]|uniref:Isoprenylcysteine carboxylmethyltransferase family protein n=1 Tax=Paracoccus caeni TaxID=657651 RepID=A0A934SF51_9RHOB|nr:isoprenylcysteine carboxylmethyltransferase family protein [Paracoccus caeni]MBK4217746.1 isoprenylcysteine carboxylmethyltransferase family protein [Paracoccus caeni]